MASVGSMSGFLSMPWSLALSALRMKLATLRPGIAVGYWKARNIPRRARLSGLSARTSRPRQMTVAAGHDVRRVAHQRVGERRLARAVGAHDRVDLARADLEVDALEDLALGRGDGRDAEAADDEAVAVGARLRRLRRRSVSVTMVVSAPSRVGWSVGVAVRGWTAIDARRDEVGEGHALERAGDGVPDAHPEQVHRAGRGALAQVVGVVLGRADHRCERPFEGAEDLAHRDRGRAAERARSRRAHRGSRRRAPRREARTRAARGRPGACPRPPRSRQASAGPAPKWRPSWTMSRTPYSPFVLNATAPVPWKAGRCGAGFGVVVSELRWASSIPSDLVGIECTNAPAERQSRSISRCRPGVRPSSSSASWAS